MPGLSASLQGHDLGHLEIIAQQWGLELQVKSTRAAMEQIESNLPAVVAQAIAILPEGATAALSELSAVGRLPWGQFIRSYGPLRDMGPGRRDKEQPHLNPISITETLWYRGLIGRAFFDTEDGPREFAYIPDELLAVLPTFADQNRPFGRPARPEERAVEIPATDTILDQACTLLAALRKELNEEQYSSAEPWLVSPKALKALLSSAELVDSRGIPEPGATRKFLEASRGEALAMLMQAWMQTADFSELHLMPGIQVEGNWTTDARAVRKKLLTFAYSAPEGQWWSLAALIADVKTRKADFQRPGADYDSWYLRDSDTGQYLRGFDHWDEVDGALIAYFVRGLLHALGLVDLASQTAGQLAAAFQWSALAKSLLKGKAPQLRPENAKLKVDSRGRILIPGLAPRAVRYLVARFCEWLPRQKDGYMYQISATSLEVARKQGLKVKQLVTLMKVNSSAPLPPNLLQALKRWDMQGTQARLGPALVLRVGSAAALRALRASRAARFLGEPLGQTAVVVKPGAGQQVMQVLMELGYLGELEGPDQ